MGRPCFGVLPVLSKNTTIIDVHMCIHLCACPLPQVFQDRANLDQSNQQLPCQQTELVVKGVMGEWLESHVDGMEKNQDLLATCDNSAADIWSAKLGCWINASCVCSSDQKPACLCHLLSFCFSPPPHPSVFIFIALRCKILVFCWTDFMNCCNKLLQPARVHEYILILLSFSSPNSCI